MLVIRPRPPRVFLSVGTFPCNGHFPARCPSCSLLAIASKPKMYIYIFGFDISGVYVDNIY